MKKVRTTRDREEWGEADTTVGFLAYLLYIVLYI